MLVTEEEGILKLMSYKIQFPYLHHFVCSITLFMVEISSESNLMFVPETDCVLLFRLYTPYITELASKRHGWNVSTQTLGFNRLIH